MGAVEVEARIKQRIQDGKDRIRAGVKRKMAKKVANVWQPIWESVLTARTKARDRVKYLLKVDRVAPTPLPDISVIIYAQGVMQVLEKTYRIIKHNKRWAVPLPENATTWTDILEKGDINHIQALFAAIPHQERVKMRHTSILSLNNFVEKTSTTTQGEVK